MESGAFATRRPRVSEVYQAVVGRPLWPMKAGILTGLAVVAIPLLLVALAGLLVGGLVYAICSAIAGVSDARPGRDAPPSPDPGPTRENVRVIHQKHF